jgi:hypothetical protein
MSISMFILVTLMQLWHLGYRFCCKDQIYMSMIISSKYCLELSFFLLALISLALAINSVCLLISLMFLKCKFRRLVASQEWLDGGWTGSESNPCFWNQLDTWPVFWLWTVICHSTSGLLGGSRQSVVVLVMLHTVAYVCLDLWWSWVVLLHFYCLLFGLWSGCPQNRGFYAKIFWEFE